MTFGGIKAPTDPMALIGILIGVLIIVKVGGAIFPLLLAGIVDLAGIENFTFGTLFEAGGLGEIIVSVLLLVMVLVAIGIKTKGAKR